MIRAFMLLRRFWSVLIGAAILAAIGIQTVRLSHVRQSLAIEKAGRLADRESYHRAQAEAAANAFAKKAEQEKKYAKIAQSADADYDVLRSRYADLLRTKSAGGPPGRTAAAAEIGTPAIHEVPAPMPIGLRTMSEADWLKLPALQAYADGCYAFGERLNAAMPASNLGSHQ